MTKIILPINENQKDYVLYLYKNRNNFHSMKDKDINNLMKLVNTGKLDETDYPKFDEDKQEKKKPTMLSGFAFLREDFSSLL